jgi:membrane-associated protease RseP (regulator of RpoE activity)
MRSLLTEFLGSRLRRRSLCFALAIVCALTCPTAPAQADVPAPDTRAPGTTPTPARTTPQRRPAGATPTAETASGAPSTTPTEAPGPSVTERVLAGIARVGPVSATITREARDLALSNLMVFASAARAVPTNLGDGVVGYRLFGIRSGSVLAALGLRNGDFLRSINGRPLTTPQEALAAYSGLRGASVWVLRVQRGGADTSLDVRVVDGDTAATGRPASSTPTPAAEPAPAATPSRQSGSSVRPARASQSR